MRFYGDILRPGTEITINGITGIIGNFYEVNNTYAFCYFDPIPKFTVWKYIPEEKVLDVLC